MQLSVAQRHVRNQDDTVEPPEAPVPKIIRTFETQFDIGGWQGGTLPGLARMFGPSHADRATRWFYARLTEATEDSVIWVSFIQLYVDFQLCWGNTGPLRVNNLWVDVASRPFLSAESHPFRNRVRWFKQLIKALVKQAGIRASFAQCRPKSSAVKTFVPSISVPWSSFALQETDIWLLEHMGAPCTRAANCLNTLPLAAKRSTMAV